MNPARRGTKAAFWYQVTVQPGATVELRLRLRPAGTHGVRRGRTSTGVVAERHAEADAFYAELTPAATSADEANVMRQAFAGMLWSKQLFYYDVARWLDGDPAQPTPPASRRDGRNARWRQFEAFDIMSMPDKWEYPWFAAWDMAFHCVTLAHVDPAFAKYQLTLLGREWFQHPNGAMPAYEWAFDDVNPPVQAWAALEVFAIDGGRDSRVPRPGLRQAAGELHLVGQPRGCLGLERVRGRLPGAGQHRPHRPLAPAARLHAPAVGRDRLDGVLRAEHGGDRRHPGPARPRHLRPGGQVPGALLAHLRRHGDPGPVGRGGRLLLRPAAASRRIGHPGQGRVDGRRAAPDGVRGHRRGDDRRGRRRSASRPRACSPDGT